MSEREALVRFRDWRAARDRKVAKRRLRRSRCIKLAEPASIGLVAALVLAAAMSSLCSRRLTVEQNFRTGR
jgi:hypothetical protein